MRRIHAGFYQSPIIQGFNGKRFKYIVEKAPKGWELWKHWLKSPLSEPDSILLDTFSTKTQAVNYIEGER